jgi:hypothetical protein
VTLGLAALGAAAGASVVFLGQVTIMLWLGLRTDGLTRALELAFDPRLLGFLVPRGALLGAVVGPPVAWTLLRRVPIGWAVLGVAAGALFGGLGGDVVLSALFQGAPMPIRFGWLWCARAGVVLAALALRWHFRPDAPSGPSALAANEALQLTDARTVAAPARAPTARLRS